MMSDVVDQVCVLLSYQQQPLLLASIYILGLPELLQHMLSPLLVACHRSNVLIYCPQEQPQDSPGLLLH